jgi:hypothetical protein
VFFMGPRNWRGTFFSASHAFPAALRGCHAWP